MPKLQGSLSLLCSVVLLAVFTAAKPPPSPSPWAAYAGKPVYSRALGPPAVSGFDTISVPYGPKTSPFFPKFVDPKTMISKKTDMLSNMFGGPGGVYPPIGKPAFFPFAAAPTLYASDDGAAFDPKAENVPESVYSADKAKRGVFGPVGPKFGPGFAPFAPKFGPFAAPPSFPFASYFSDPSAEATGKESFSRKRREVASDASAANLVAANKPDVKGLGPPPAYPGLSTIAEEPEAEENLGLDGGPTAPKQFLPGMFGPFSPFSPVVDPSLFIAKKSSFLDTLFKNIATSTTPAPDAVTDGPTPKSTIVPADFWAPSAIIPGPAEYSQKVSSFLDKLFDSLKLNKTTTTTTTTESAADGKVARSVYEKEDAAGKVARSVQDLTTITAAKDTIVDSIMTELSDLKGDMVKTLTDLIAYEKSLSAPPAGAKKPFKPFAGIWGKPPVDGTLPFQQKLTVLSQVFDMLTELQKNVTLAVQNAVKSSASSTDAPSSAADPAVQLDNSYGSPYNLSLIDAIVKRMSAMDTITPYAYSAENSKVARTLPKTSSFPFWESYPENSGALEKRSSGDSKEALIKDEEVPKQYASRAVKMQMHQGYQSLPAGAVESVQAGGGSVPGHQGGGIKLLDTSDYGDWEKYADWTQYLANENQGRRHHHHNH